jgi:hypothetical protein
MLTCSNGCGEFYFDEWINEPPERCDPCDNFGRYVGPQTHCRPWLAGLRGLRGYRGCGSCEGGCGLGKECGCGDAGCAGDAGMMESASPEGIDGPVMEPTPAKEASRPKPYYTPEKQRVTKMATPQRARSATRSAHYLSTPQAPVGSGVRPASR